VKAETLIGRAIENFVNSLNQVRTNFRRIWHSDHRALVCLGRWGRWCMSTRLCWAIRLLLLCSNSIRTQRKTTS